MRDDSAIDRLVTKLVYDYGYKRYFRPIYDIRPTLELRDRFGATLKVAGRGNRVYLLYEKGKRRRVVSVSLKYDDDREFILEDLCRLLDETINDPSVETHITLYGLGLRIGKRQYRKQGKPNQLTQTGA